MTSLLPSRSTATISCVPQSANQSRSSCQRGDSPKAIPVIKVCVSFIEHPFEILLRYPSTPDYLDRKAPRPTWSVATVYPTGAGSLAPRSEYDGHEEQLREPVARMDGRERRGHALMDDGAK